MDFKNTLHEVFYQFVGDDQLRPNMHAPFEVEGVVYATNAYSVIYTEKKNCDFDYNQNSIPQIKNVLPSQTNTNQLIDLKLSEFEEYLTEIETSFKEESIECNECNGYGEVEWDYKHYSKEFECPACDGFGTVDKSKEVPTGGKIHQEVVIEIKGHAFLLNRIIPLIKTADLLKKDIYLVYSPSEPYQSLVFKIDFLTIVVMPFSNSTYFKVIKQIA
ncbi:hypothetical protein [Chishuiella changwenlii]|uniref:hypothetical protein n=1 Tax=Chishuiella changwenlii TaxID=1434701 RepID=UPI002FDA0D29